MDVKKFLKLLKHPIINSKFFLLKELLRWYIGNEMPQFDRFCIKTKKGMGYITFDFRNDEFKYDEI